MAILLKDFSESDIPDVVALQNQLYPLPKRWNLDEARAQLLDLARNRGKNVAKVVQGSSLLGLVGWVSSLQTKEFFGAPFFATSKEAAQLLIEQLLKCAKVENSIFIRVGVYDFEREKLKALNAYNFKKSFDFIEVERSTNDYNNFPSVENNLKFVPSHLVQPKKYMELYNITFKEVANAPPADEAQAREIWNSSLLNKELSGIWIDQDGNYAAFLLVHDGGYIDSIGISPSLQKRGIAKTIYQDLFSKAHALGLGSLHATIASNNTASLVFHRNFGFKEIERRERFGN